jgi:uncharacterized membrane protein
MALGVPGYSYGALLGIALLALVRKGSWKSILMGTILSLILVVYLSFAFEIGFFWRYPLGALTVLVFVYGYEWFLSSCRSKMTLK